MRSCAKVVANMPMGWLGGRDSNPDTVVQSHVSYRWTTSQYRGGAADRRETLSILNTKGAYQARRASTGTSVNSGRHSGRPTYDA